MHRINCGRLLAAAAALLVMGLSSGVADSVVLKGTVLLPDGAPAGGATVYGRCIAPGEVVQGRAGADGRFRLELSYTGKRRRTAVAAVLPGYALGAGEGEVGETDLVIRLGDNPTSYRGRVCDPEGTPLAGATVVVNSVGGSGLSAWFGEHSPWRVSSGADGRFEVASLPRATTVSLSVGAPGRAWVTRGVRTEGPTPAFALPVEGVICGRVLWNGRPVPGVTVRATSHYGVAYTEAVTGPDGAYRLDRIAGRVDYLAIDNPPAGAFFQWVEGFPLRPGETTTGHDLTLVEAATLSGQVTEAGTGRPLEGQYVSAAWDYPNGAFNDLSRSAETDAQGRYRLTIPVGQVGVWVGDDYLGLEGAQSPVRQVDLKAGETRGGLDFSLPPPEQLRGHVLRPDGTPAAGVEVMFPSRMSYDRKYGVTTTDATGAWQLPLGRGSARPGSGYRGMVMARDVAAGLVTVIWIADVPEDLRLTLAPGGWVNATATDPQGHPVGGEGFTAYLGERLEPGEAPPATPWRVTHDYMFPSVETDQQGQARCGPLPPNCGLYLCFGGSSTFAVSVPAPVRGREELVVQPGEEKVLPPVIINQAGRTVSGQVVDEHGQPVAGATVYASDVPAPVGTDAQGRFTLRRLPMRGRVWLLAADPVRPLFGAVQMDPDRDPAPRLVLQRTGRARGQLVDEQGAPRAGATVRWAQDIASDLGSAWSDGEVRDLLGLVEDNYGDFATAEGRFQTGELVAGLPCKLHFYAPPDLMNRHAELDFTVKPGQTVDLGQIVLRK